MEKTKSAMSDTVNEIMEEVLGHSTHIARAAMLAACPLTCYLQVFPAQDEEAVKTALSDIVLCTGYYGSEETLKEILMQSCKAIEEYGPVIKMVVCGLNLSIEFGKSIKTFELEPGLDLVGIMLGLEQRAHLHADARSRVKALAENKQYKNVVVLPVSNGAKYEDFISGYDFVAPSHDYCGSVQIHINTKVPHFRELDLALKCLMGRSSETNNNFRDIPLDNDTCAYSFNTNEQSYQGLISALDLIRSFGDLLLLKAAFEKRYSQYAIKIVDRTVGFDIEVCRRNNDTGDDLLRTIAWSQNLADNDGWARFHVRDQLWYETLAIQILNVIEEHELSD